MNIFSDPFFQTTDGNNSQLMEIEFWATLINFDLYVIILFLLTSPSFVFLKHYCQPTQHTLQR